MKFRNVAIASTAAVIASVAIGTGAAQATSLIGGKDIRDGSVHRIDLSAGVNKALNKAGTPGAKGEQGTPGAKGEPGDKGDKGEPGANATLNTYVVQSEFAVPAGESNKADGNVWCNAGDRLLSGGYSSNDHNNHWSKIYQNRVTWSDAAQAAAVANGKAADAQPDGWYVQALGGDADSAIRLWAYCTTVN